MTTVEDIEKAIAKLSAPEFDRLRDWFEEFQAARFDAKIERDAKAGKLDRLAEEALAEHQRPQPRAMRHFASPAFWDAYAKLPAAVRELAERNYALLKQRVGWVER
jgi:hypothetical protein